MTVVVGASLAALWSGFPFNYRTSNAGIKKSDAFSSAHREVQSLRIEFQAIQAELLHHRTLYHPSTKL